MDGALIPFDSEFFDVVLYVWFLHEMSLNDINVSISEACRVVKRNSIVQCILLIKRMLPSFDYMREVAVRVGLKMDHSKVLLHVYDHGCISNALLLKYVEL